MPNRGLLVAALAFIAGLGLGASRFMNGRRRDDKLPNLPMSCRSTAHIQSSKAMTYPTAQCGSPAREPARQTSNVVVEAATALGAIVLFLAVLLNASAALPIIKGLPNFWWYAELSVSANLCLLFAEGLGVSVVLLVMVVPLIVMTGTSSTKPVSRTRRAPCSVR